MKSILIAGALLISLLQCGSTGVADSDMAGASMDEQTPELIKEWDGVKVEKTEAEWRELLTEQAYYVLREAGTERAFSDDLYKNKEEGSYSCSGCGLLLFDSKTKFKSGTGWPSFYDVVGENHVGEISDESFGMVRTEVVCNRCEGHLGHVFGDGPAPTGLRYCINGVSLDFHKAE